jgi:hypothetical protein
MDKQNFWAVIEPKDIEDGNILSALSTIRELDNRERKGEHVFRTLSITFRGFDDTDAELWEMPKVREWVHKLINRVPHLFYYVENDWYQTEQTLMLCMNGFEYKEEAERGVDSGEEHKLAIHIHQKSYRDMVSELRKHAHQQGMKTPMETVIAQMNQRYGVDA